MRNTYIDGNLEIAKQRRCDIIQLKYDGHWCRAVCGNGEITYFSDTDRVFRTDTEYTGPNCTVIGEMMRGTQWAQHPDRKGLFFVWDCWEINGFANAQVYKRRYVMLRNLMERLPKHFRLSPLFRLSDRNATWQKFVEEEGYEGLVYRWSEGMNDHPIVREKKVFTLEGLVIDVIPGEGKHEGRMGALLVRLKDGTETSIGNGFDDETRCLKDEWFLHKTLEFTCNAIFESGNVRHGRFVRWREDR